MARLWPWNYQDGTFEQQRCPYALRAPPLLAFLAPLLAFLATPS